MICRAVRPTIRERGIILNLMWAQTLSQVDFEFLSYGPILFGPCLLDPSYVPVDTRQYLKFFSSFFFFFGMNVKFYTILNFRQKLQR